MTSEMKTGAEKINPYGEDGRQKREQVEEMFDNIAPGYDFMNRAMTMGVDRSWRKTAVKMLRKALETKAAESGSDTAPAILDLAAGTADLSLLMARRIPDSTIVGVDLSEGMIEIGRRKIAESALDGRVELRRGDCLNLDFGDGEFDAVTSAFGVRNFQDLKRGYEEMYRVLRPGGRLCIIEMSYPKSRIVRPFYNLYAGKIIPAVGRLKSKDVRAYSYLPESIRAVPCGEKMCGIIASVGFNEVACRTLTFGVCSIYTACKPW